MRNPLRAARMVISVLAVGWVVRTLLSDPRTLSLFAQPLHRGFLAATALLPCLATVLGAARYRILLAEEGLALPFGWLLRETLVGRFIGAFTPSTTGLDGYRTLSVTRRTGEPLRASRALIVEKALGLAGLAAVTSACAALGVRGVAGRTAWLAALACIALSALAFGIVRSPERLARWMPRRIGLLERVRARAMSLSGSRARLGPVMVSLGLGLFSHALTALAFATSALAIGLTTHPLVLFAIGNAIVLATLLPISIGGIGVREGTAVMLLGSWSVASGEAVFVAVLTYVCSQLPAVLGGLIAAFSPSHHPRGSVAHEMPTNAPAPAK